jgi:hypothetical protein
MDGQSATLARNASMISTLDESGRSQQVVEVSYDKEEWEICDIIGKEDVDGEPHYWVEWSPTFVPKCEMGKARALVARFEARLRAQGRQRGGRQRGKLPPLKVGN